MSKWIFKILYSSIYSSTTILYTRMLQHHSARYNDNFRIFPAKVSTLEVSTLKFLSAMSLRYMSLHSFHSFQPRSSWV